MPAANRGWSRLTPTGAPHLTWDYLKAQPPACSTLAASLAVLLLFIVVYLGLRCLPSVGRLLRTPYSAVPRLACTSEIVDSETVEEGTGPAVNEKDNEGKKSGSSGTMGALRTEQLRPSDRHGMQGASRLAIDPQWSKATDDHPVGIMSRPPPAPPLTPPVLSTSVFTFTSSRHGQDSFMHQPNPDYMSSTASPTSQHSPVSQHSPTFPGGPRRRSYTKLIPSGPSTSYTSSPTQQHLTDASLLSSSYPPTATLLPPAPPSLQHVEDASRHARQIEVQGEIISVLDGQGAGWTRHTRVYGGGVCLACAASGSSHGGGFYGANVTPEEMH